MTIHSSRQRGSECLVESGLVLWSRLINALTVDETAHDALPKMGRGYHPFLSHAPVTAAPARAMTPPQTHVLLGFTFVRAAACPTVAAPFQNHFFILMNLLRCPHIPATNHQPSFALPATVRYYSNHMPPLLDTRPPSLNIPASRHLPPRHMSATVNYIAHCPLQITSAQR